jgi:hypothetical protein
MAGSGRKAKKFCSSPFACSGASALLQLSYGMSLEREYLSSMVGTLENFPHVLRSSRVNQLAASRAVCYCITVVVAEQRLKFHMIPHVHAHPPPSVVHHVCTFHANHLTSVACIGVKFVVWVDLSRGTGITLTSHMNLSGKGVQSSLQSCRLSDSSDEPKFKRSTNSVLSNTVSTFHYFATKYIAAD